MKNLENYQQLEVLDLSQNHIEDISNIAFYQNLWKVDLSFNKITCLDGLTPFIALGCLNLSHNQVSWSELLKIRHIQILDLMLFGNPNLEKEKLYRIHLIDSLPNVWMLDGKLVTGMSFSHD
uniref:Dynein assembly factor 1, axonemal homolog n=1 Tax=Octopus bimaculoides TaxID=37653 RepID=A0A0L8I9A6_OCTBM